MHNYPCYSLSNCCLPCLSQWSIVLIIVSWPAVNPVWASVQSSFFQVCWPELVSNYLFTVFWPSVNPVWASDQSSLFQLLTISMPVINYPYCSLLTLSKQVNNYSCYSLSVCCYPYLSQWLISLFKSVGLHLTLSEPVSNYLFYSFLTCCKPCLSKWTIILFTVCPSVVCPIWASVQLSFLQFVGLLLTLSEAVINFCWYSTVKPK